jgi:hypothetical protein
MQRVSYGTIRRRQGTGLIPPNTKQWNVEHHALDLREELDVGFDVPLDHLLAFRLVPGATVVPHGQIPAADEFLDHFRHAGLGNWSGMAIPLGPDEELVVYNDAHALTRVRATLMEEFFHLRFGHPRSTVRLLNTDGKNRTMDPTVELEAYHTGAAALVPFVALKARVEDGQTLGEIAEYFQVSPDLVEFRAKVTKLYHKLRRPRRRRR